MPQPQAVADHRDCRRAAVVFRGQETPAERRSHAEHVEDAGAGPGAADAFGLAVRGERESWRIVRGHRREGGRASFEVEEVERRGLVLAAGLEIARRDRHEPIGIRVGQRPQQGGIDDAEDREVDADAECEYRGDGRSARSAEAAGGVAQVLSQLVEQPLTASLAQVFLQRLQAPELEPGLALGVGFRRAGPHQVVDAGVEMEPQLVGHAGFELAPAGGDTQRRAQRPEQTHVTPRCPQSSRSKRNRSPRPTGSSRRSRRPAAAGLLPSGCRTWPCDCSRSSPTSR